jgi:TetR/AcrR family transcriptional regulator, transcriptional repressor for nem operon
VRVSREQAAKTRQRIVKVAGRLFRERGFGGVAVADIMQKAGLTHGGFYAHFDSKADLEVEASAAALLSGVSKFVSNRNESGRVEFSRVIDAYLSAEHRDNAGSGCTLAALASEAARSTRALRHAFEEGLDSYVNAIAKVIPEASTVAKRQKAIATMAGLVGGIVLARAVDDPATSDEILRATSTRLKEL